MTGEGVAIRLAREEDVENVFALEREVAEAPHWNKDDYAAMVREGEVGEIRRSLYIAEQQDGMLVGFAVGKVVVRARSSELESIAVKQTSRRLGIGRRLIEHVADWCRSQGATVMELEVRAANDCAIRLYRFLGFVAEGVRPRYYRDPVDDALLMQLDL
jgi:ribosomal-protein-alanine N-acetyltransferase